MSNSSKQYFEVPDVPFPVVGLGASAGGLEAIRTFIQTIPKNTGMAYVFVQHLNSEHESFLPEILSKVSKIPVKEVTDDIRLEKDNFYTVPSNKSLVAVDGKLKLENKKESNKTIDLFFSSLGVVHQSFAVGIILSGTLNDGTIGLQVIKTYGGITLAQDERSAAFESMPKSAIRSGAVDFILPPEEMIGKLIQLNQPFHEDYSQTQIRKNIPEKTEEIFRQLLTILKVRRGVDFAYYKTSTLKRRIVRRMALCKMLEPEQYLSFVRENKLEQDALFNDMLISVTSFFRDPGSFELLCNTIFPILLSQKKGSNILRIWIAGCATGEEAYSMAMCVHEFLGNKADAMKIRIFATDISEQALAKARTGIYRLSELEGVSPSRLRQFFTKLDGNYQINRSIRDMCVFAQHNLLKDPPFSQMDLISCRNVLIYLEPVLQKRALNTFHYSLTEKGYLMLGRAESVGSQPDLFRPDNSHEKIFSRIGPRGRFMNVTTTSSEQNMSDQDQEPKIMTDQGIFKAADDLLLLKFTPSGVLVNEHHDIIQFRGQTDVWLSPSPGKASLNLLKMAREGLSFEIRNLLALAKKTNQAARREGIFFKNNSEQHYVNIEVLPITGSDIGHYLVLFQNSQQADKYINERAFAIDKEPAEDSRNLHIKQLEKELMQVREDMRSITEMQEAANEELQSSNEELLSSSEELQSLNEELETSKEELQSTNEEIIIVNKELIERNELLNTARNYTEGIISTIRDPLLILDKSLRVLRATEGFYKKFKTTEKETEGKYLYDLGFRQWDIPGVIHQLEQVLPDKKSFEDFEVTQNFPGLGPRIMYLNARQIESLSGEQLILFSIEDITYKRKVEQGLAEAEMLVEEYTERLRFATLSAELGTWDYNILTKELIADRRCKELFGLEPSEATTLKSFAGKISDTDRETIKSLLANTREGKNKGVYELEMSLKSTKVKWIKAKGKTFNDEHGVPNFISGIVQDISPQKLVEEEMKDLLRKKDEFISTASHELRTPITTIKAALQLAERNLDKNEDPAKVHLLIKKANVNLTKLVHLLTALMDATKIQSGNLLLNQTYVSLKEVIDDCCEQMETIYPSHQIVIEGNSNFDIFADKTKIEQVIVNLLSNAIKYSPNRNKVILKISRPTSNVRIEVIDFGIGIQKDELPHIFDRFFRVEKSSHDFAGLGLGLYISSEIIERHRGEMGIESEPGNGSIFWFTLPISQRIPTADPLS